MEHGRYVVGEAEPFGGRSQEDDEAVQALLAEIRDASPPSHPEAAGAFGGGGRVPLGLAMGDAAVAMGTLHGAAPSWHPASRLPSLRVPAVRQALEAAFVVHGIRGLGDTLACSIDTCPADLVAATVGVAEAAAGIGEAIAPGALGDARLLLWRGVPLVVVRDLAGHPLHLVGPAFIDEAPPPRAGKARKAPRRSKPPGDGPRPPRAARRSRGTKAR